MKSSKSLFFIIPLLTLLSCIEDYSIQPADRLYTPFLISSRNNEEVTLKWGKPACPYCGICVCPQLAPDYFEILISDSDPTEIRYHATVSDNIFQVTVINLTNGKPYYFAIKAFGNNGQFTTSMTIMTIPDNPENIQPLFNTIDKSSQKGTWSPDQGLVAYESDYVWDNGNYMVRSIFISSPSTNLEWLVEKNSFSPEWSPTEQKIVYYSENNIERISPGYSPAHIVLYNIQDSTKRRLTGGDSFNFVPTWSPDEDWIAFLSDMARGNEYNLWKIPSDSGTAIQVTSDFNDLTDLAIMDSRSMKKPSWSKDGNEIAFSRLKKVDYGYVFDIYTVPSTGGNRETIVSSPWNDCSPVFSPDGKEIAFVSDRSGSNKIWTINLQTKELRQITGSNGLWVFENWGKIEWSASGDKILFTSSFDNFHTLYTVDVK